MPKTFFTERPEVRPTIYAYEDTNPQYAGLLKVGYTTIGAAVRVGQQYPTLKPGAKPYRIVLEEPAMRDDGTAFMDHDVHRQLRHAGFLNPNGEWFQCSSQGHQSGDQCRAQGAAGYAQSLARIRHAPGAGGSGGKDGGLFSLPQAQRREPSTALSLECQDALWQDLRHL
jgi:hypothetical protein